MKDFGSGRKERLVRRYIMKKCDEKRNGRFDERHCEGFACDVFPCFMEEQKELNTEEKAALEKIDARIESREIIEQKAWKFIKELNSYSEKRLDSVAIVDGKREYTFRQMFRKWERYAKVFSALGICESNHSRVGMGGCPSVETVSSMYALNMTGTSVSFIHALDINDMEKLRMMVEQENITDIILPDYKLNMKYLRRIIEEKETLGIRNVIILHVPLMGPFAHLFDEIDSLEKYNKIKRKHPDVLFMDELLRKYKDTSISYAENECDQAAVITHTSGTTTGVRKPIPISDRGINETSARMLNDDRFSGLKGRAVSCLTMDLSSSYACMDMLNLPLAYGGTVVVLPMLNPGPDLMMASLYYQANVIFGMPMIFDALMRAPIRPDFSDLELVFIGGSYTSADDKKKFNKYLKKCGFDKGVMVGYGLSEGGGACILADPDRKDDSMGRPLSGIRIKLFDEDEKKFYDLDDGPRTGVMYMSSPSVSCGCIDDRVFFKLEEIDGEKYLNTYDLVRVGEDGALYYEGRMNKFFVNNDGVRFDAGLVEKAVSSQKDIISCGLVPGYGRALRDTIPILYVQTRLSAEDSREIVREALVQAFIREEKIKETNLPSECVITDDIPYNTMGKVDSHQITTGKVDGYRYNVIPVRESGELKDIKLEEYDSSPMASVGIPEELESTFKWSLR